MTTSEFSNEFDVLFNNITSNLAPGLTEYEKSVFLTKALNELLKAYFSPSTNKSHEGFDGSQKRQYDFSNLIRTASLFNVNSVKERVTMFEKTDRRSQVFLFPYNYFLSINEIIFDDTQMYSVIPVSYDEYQRLMLKPYALPAKKAAWRLFTDKKNCNYAQRYVNGTYCDYSLLSTWADLKRNLLVTIKYLDTLEEGDYDLFTLNIPIVINSNRTTMNMGTSTGWANNNLTYNIEIGIKPILTGSITKKDFDDETVIRVLRELYKTIIPITEEDGGDVAKACSHLDALIQATAPSKFYEALSNTGIVFNTSAILVPIVEIIGKFFGNITYLLRYIRKPSPIILVDLENEGVTIGGLNKVTECELSSETHPEILLRAIELAKAAYIGDLNSLLALGLTSQTNMGIVTQNK